MPHIDSCLIARGDTKCHVIKIPQHRAQNDHASSYKNVLGRLALNVDASALNHRRVLEFCNFHLAWTLGHEHYA